MWMLLTTCESLQHRAQNMLAAHFSTLVTSKNPFGLPTVQLVIMCMVTEAVLLWVTVCQWAELVGAARLDAVATTSTTEQVDCTNRRPSLKPLEENEPVESSSLGVSFGWTNTHAVRKYWVVDLGKSECDKSFVYSERHGGWVVPKRTPIAEQITGGGNMDLYTRHIYACVVSERGKKGEGRAKFCEVENFEKDSRVWKSIVKKVEEDCLSILCGLAATGKWREGGWWKRRQAKKMSWRRTMKDSLGYQQAFETRCWKGPPEEEDFFNPKVERILPEFDDFVNKYHLSKDDGTFDKLVCE